MISDVLFTATFRLYNYSIICEIQSYLKQVATINQLSSEFCLCIIRPKIYYFKWIICGNSSPTFNKERKLAPSIPRQFRQYVMYLQYVTCSVVWNKLPRADGHFKFALRNQSSIKIILCLFKYIYLRLLIDILIMWPPQYCVHMFYTKP